MIRFGRILDASTPAARRKLAEVQVLFRRIFPREAEYAERLGRLIEHPSRRDFDVLLITAEDRRGTVIGFALLHFFPAIRYAFLDYIGSDPKKRHRGIGRALYEAARESLAGRGAKGLFLEVPPDDDGPLPSGALSTSQARMKFYEQFGARPIVGTRWDDPPERPDYDPPHLVFDPLGRGAPLSREDARKAARAILASRYHRRPDDPYTIAIVQSFRADPLKLRPPRYEPARPPARLIPRHGQLKPIKVLAPEHHEIHHVRERGFVERPARIGAIMRAMIELPIELLPVKPAGEGPIKAVHAHDFVAFLKAATNALGEEDTLYPQIFPIRRPERKPRDLLTRAGYYCSDTFTPLSRSAYRAARAAVDCVVSAAEALARGEMLVYAICRPPGHHAERRIYGGFCYFCNAAIAAHRLAALGRVAILDIDYHHGNGQQDIFYARSDVFTVSLHGDPKDHYPHFAGYRDERGEGEGHGHNRNYPLRPMIGDEKYSRVLERALRAIRGYKPMWLLVALGFDTMRGDPTGNFDLSPRGLRSAGEAIARLRLPTLVVQEGGYTLRNLRIGAKAFFTGLAAGW